MNDRFGLGWRPELAAGILSNLDRIDIVEVIADDYFDAPKSKRRALKTLATQVPVALHGVTLGLASSIAADSKRLERTARLADEIQPEFWSEHLAFVRGGGLEIGHLAAPPRTEATIEGAAWNLDRRQKDRRHDAARRKRRDLDRSAREPTERGGLDQRNSRCGKLQPAPRPA